MPARPALDEHVPEPHPGLARQAQAPLTLLVAMHVLDKVEQGHEAAYLLARAARRAALPAAERAKPVLLVHHALRSLNRLDRAAALAVRGEPARLEPWRRQLLRVAALLGELGVPERGVERDLLPWAGLMARWRDRRRDAERQAVAAARLARAYLEQPEQRGAEELALRTGHPAWFVGLARQLLGPEARALLQANNEDPPLVVRANTLRGSRAELQERLAREGFTARPTRWSPLGLAVEPKEGAFRTRAFREGRFEAQDEGSQLLALLVGAQPGQWVLDACAGAGGKTLLLAAQMRNKGRIIALDTHQGRLLELKRRAARAGADNCEALVVTEDGGVKGSARALRAGAEPARSALPRRQYDAVLVDAPCSGLGTLRRTPELRWRHDPASLQGYPPRQLAILEQQAARVKPGGRLVYATCTILPGEDEGVVQRFLAAHPEFQLRSAADGLPGVRAEGLVDSSGFLRLWPHRHGTEGFFGALLQRAG